LQRQDRRELENSSLLNAFSWPLFPVDGPRGPTDLAAMQNGNLRFQ
jgi:hypothetical protein